MEPTRNSPWNSHVNYPHHPSMFFSSNHPSRNFNLNQDEDNEELDDQTSIDNTENPDQNPDQNLLDHEREPMFEKPLTPSDVGKLNRLVIPKQHAEKYFPLGGDSGDKGLLLSFEDESGWRRRGVAVAVAAAAVVDGGNPVMVNNCGGVGGGGGNEGWSSRGLYQGHPYLGHIQGHGANVPYQPDCLHAVEGSMVQNQAAPAGNPKRLLRLFGVNLECQLDESEPSTPDSSSVSNQGPTTQQFYSHSYTSNYMVSKMHR
ncbi:hypothetical protein REPUB_Repub02eG0214100 [Reevesia pubescens]